ncbi:MAG: sulfite exporter TauE/SafE family protein [Syntrophobacteraceae bacterium]|nr:sulfite exporter TauE/SafE family protein [Syntrophobacteraceae bacterium]MDR3714194.1 sulfite exporter TauE/SafE family protein [Puia sp.]
MAVTMFSTLIFAGSMIAGLLGALTGLGGGVVIVPLLTLGFGVNIRYAIGASLVSVIATSSGAAAAYVREGFSNIRLGMFLEMATTLGAFLGAGVAALISTRAIAIIFGLVLLYSAYLSFRHPAFVSSAEEVPDSFADSLRLDSSYPSLKGPVSYHVHHIPGGFSLCFLAGGLSGLLGIGGGAVKVMAMDQYMHIPFKASATTSNFMIGVTAAASAGVYLSRGYIDPGLTMPVMLGVVAGAFLGSKVLTFSRTALLRILFALTITVLGFEMIYNGILGNI